MLRSKIVLCFLCFLCSLVLLNGQGLEAPTFHHLHLNSANPEAAIDFYTRQFPSTSKTTFAGAPALKSPNNVLVLFNKLKAAPALQPQTAIWHFGWHVTDVRKNMKMYQIRAHLHQRPEVKLLPLYTTDEGGFVFVSSDTWPGTGGVLGLTKAQIADAKAKGVQPAGGAGFAYLQGPDGAIVEYQGNMPAERFNHVHMYWEEPFCAQLWYQKHLNASIGGRGSQYTESNCKVPRGPDRSWPALEKEGTYRTPGGNVTFGDVSLNFYMRQDDHPLISTRGHLADHFALGVQNLPRERFNSSANCRRKRIRRVEGGDCRFGGDDEAKPQSRLVAQDEQGRWRRTLAQLPYDRQPNGNSSLAT